MSTKKVMSPADGGAGASHPAGTLIEDDRQVLAPGHTYETVTDQVSDLIFQKVRPEWAMGLLVAFGMLNLLMVAVGWLFIKGVGVWGINIPIAWAWDITNFVWWIGIGHAGTLISAILLLFRQKWRTSINRFAEAMTLFAVACAGLFPLIHLGRPWKFFWLFPYPNTMGMWPQFRSPLMWDVFAVSTYATVSAIFWFVGLVPDVATLRDRVQNRFGKIIFGMMALGWRGSARHWARYEMAYLLLAGIATPLVLSVHSIVSLDFSVGIIPGWHTTIFPPYFVAGAIYSGFAMVLTLMIPLRKYYHLEDFITARHLNNMAKVMLLTGLMVAYGYIVEAFGGWYSGNRYDRFMMYNRLTGPYAPHYFSLLFCNLVFPQLLWFRKVRRNPIMLFVIAIVVNIGMWLERFIIIVTSLHRDFLPSSWGMFHPTIWDISTFIGTLGLFLTLIFLFVRFLPVISIFEMRHLVDEENGHHSEGGT
jgi:Ni/Fe-hydrogenase subunit HybB-like protein